MIAYVIHISGRVQGVGFRWFTEKEARARNVKGYVRNLQDGRVEVVAQGEREDVAQLCDALRQGPSASRVDAVAMTPVGVDAALSSFSVRF